MSANPRILIVEDDPIISHLLAAMLQKHGYTVAGYVTSGEEAIVKSVELDPDLIFMDVGLSGEMDGIDAAHYIFQLFQYPVIFVTGISDEKQLQRIRYAQPYGIIFKPFNMIGISTNVELAIYNNSCQVRCQEQYPVGDPKKIMEMLEAVIITDKLGRIIFYNPSVSWYVDLPPGQLLMKSWREVMTLINDLTNEQLKDPVAEAANYSLSLILETNTAIVTTTSKRRKVNVSVRPILDNRGKFLAVLMSIKEKAQTRI